MRSSHPLTSFEREFRLVKATMNYPKGSIVTIGYIADGEASRGYVKVNDKLASGQEAEPLLHDLAVYLIAFPTRHVGFLEEL